MTDESFARPQPEVGVLICDDYASMRALLRVIIEERPGMAVVGEAADGNEVIVEATRLQPDVILLDLAMPNKTGLEALQQLTVIAPAARVIVFSGFSMTSVNEDVAALGAVLYLQKGASPEAIIDAIEEAAAMTTPVTATTGSSRPANT